MYAFTHIPTQRVDADDLIWYEVQSGGRPDDLRLSVDPTDHWPNVWRGVYPLGTSVERDTILRAWAAYLHDRLDGALDTPHHYPGN